MDEVWGEIEGFPNYAISNYGEVVNIKFGRSLKPRTNSRGYQHVVLFGEHGRKDYYIHQLVAEVFLGDFRPGAHVRHLDGKKHNNKVTNLRLRGGTSEHYEIEYVRGRRVRIIETGQVFINAYACANFIGGQASNIYACLRGKNHKHLGYTFEYLEET